jgi:hypothetical protein
MRREILAIAGACAFLPGAPATACGRSPHIAYIHSDLPKPLPRGMFIALVDLNPRGDRAWIRRMIQGDRPGDYVVLRPTWWSSCNAPLANGRSGFMIAVALGKENGVLIVDPIEVGPEENYRLPDGWQFPDRYKPPPLSDAMGEE